MTTIKKQQKKKGHYLTNKEFLEEIIECQTKNKMSGKLGEMFLILTKKISTKHNFSGYSYLDEMVSSGLLACCSAFNKFNKEKSNNPFAYFSQIIWTAFLQVLNKEKRHQEIRDEILVKHNMVPSYSYCEKHGEYIHINEEENQNDYDFEE